MGLLLWLFPVGGSGWSRPGLFSVVGRNMDTCSGCSAVDPVHPVLYAGSSDPVESQLQEPVWQKPNPASEYFWGDILSALPSQRSVWERC